MFILGMSGMWLSERRLQLDTVREKKKEIQYILHSDISTESLIHNPWYQMGLLQVT